MARLPTVSNRTAIFQGPQSAVSGAAAANPYMQIADAMGTIGTKLEEQSVIKAEQDGADAVYRDENGTLQMDQRSNWSKSGQAYNRAAQQSYAARISGDIRSKGQELFNSAQGDVSAFNASWKGFGDQLLSDTPKEYRGPLKTMLETEGSRLGLGVSEQKRKRDLSVFENDIKTEIQFLDNDMAALARAGGTATPDYLEKQGQLQSLYKELVDNPEFTVSEKQAQMELQRVESRHMSEAVVGQIDKTLATGGVKAAQQDAERILTDEKLHLSPAERRQYAGLAEERIRGFVAEQKVALKPIQDQATNFKKLLEQGVGIDNPSIDTTIATLARGGDVAGALDLQAKRRAAQTVQQFNLASPEARVSALERGRAAASGINLPNSTNRGGGSLFDLIDKTEGGGNYSTLFAHAQRPGGAFAGVDVRQMTIGQLDQFANQYGPWVRNELARQGQKPRIATPMGRHQIVNSTLQAAAKEMGLSSDTVFSEDVQDAIAMHIADKALSGPKTMKGKIDALRGQWEGFKNVSDANLSAAITSYENGDRSALTATSGTGSRQTVNADVIKSYREGVTSDAKESWSELKDGISKGIPPAAGELSLLSRQLSVIDDPKFRREVTDYLSSDAAASMFAGMPPQQASAIIDELKVDAGDGATVAQQQILEAAERTANRTAEALKNDPIGYAAERQWAQRVPDLDVAAGPDAVGSAFAARQQTVDLLQARGLVQPGTSALRPADKTVLSQVMTQGTPGEQAALFGAMSKSLSPQTYRATMTALAGDANSRTSASAGALYQYNPQVAEGVLRGQALLKENPNYAPKKTDDNQASIDDILPPQAFGSGLEASRQMLLDSARARYADLSNTAGDTSGEFNRERMTQAVNEVTGGMIDFNGQSIIAPRYGMVQEDFDSTIKNLPNSALSGAITSEGQQITASDLRRYGRLRAVGEGRYLLEFGLKNAPTYAMSKPITADNMSARAGGGPFILDLRGER